MSRPQLILKQPTGWFAAGWQFGEALVELSDAAFKLYAWLCLNADRHTGQLQTTQPELSSAMRQPESWVASSLRELFERDVCRWLEADVLEVADRYWPYERPSRRDKSPNYVDEVRRMLLAPACIRCRFTTSDERLARDLDQRGVSLEQLRRAIWLGCTRKYMAMLNGQPPMPITSLRYFTGLIEEVGQSSTPDSYWQHVRLKADQFERQWLQQQGRAAAVPLR
jgi:hypothetical protein